MSNTEDTYIDTLEAVAAALTELRDSKYAAAQALSIDRVTFENYDAAKHSTAVDEHAGVCQALVTVYGMIENAWRAAA